MMKGTFAIREGERACRVESQPAILTSDVFHSKPNESSLRQESELVPRQPRADVTFNAVARSPERKELEGWSVRVMIDQRATHTLHVCGARQWEPSGVVLKSWKLSERQKMTELPLRYEYAYGGIIRDGENLLVHEFNPVGRGFLGGLPPRQNPVPAPQIGLLAEFAALNPREEMMVCGLGPISKSWLPRRSLAGTFNDVWLREQHPRMPDDYSLAFWNGAPSALQIDPYLTGDETMTVKGVRHDPKPYAFSLPGLEWHYELVSSSSRRSGKYRLNLQSVHCDLADPDPDKHWMSLVWRAAFQSPEEVAEIKITGGEIEQKKIS